MRLTQTLSRSRIPLFVRTLNRRFLHRTLQRRVVCYAVALNLLLWPGPGDFTPDALTFSARLLKAPIG